LRSFERQGRIIMLLCNIVAKEGDLHPPYILPEWGKQMEEARGLQLTMWSKL
jgi:hypothetical protein